MIFLVEHHSSSQKSGRHSDRACRWGWLPSHDYPIDNSSSCCSNREIWNTCLYQFTGNFKEWNSLSASIIQRGSKTLNCKKNNKSSLFYIMLTIFSQLMNKFPTKWNCKVIGVERIIFATNSTSSSGRSRCTRSWGCSNSQLTSHTEL